MPNQQSGPPVRLYWDGKHVPAPLLPPALTLVERAGAEPEPGWRNRLIAADNREALAALAAECAGQVACVYIDPPFATGAAFQTTAPAGTPRPAYTDDHGGLAPYLQMLYEVFGAERFRNEIIWRYRRWPARARLFQRMHDTIFWYSMAPGPTTWHQLYEALSPSSLAQWGGKRRVDRRSSRGT